MLWQSSSSRAHGDGITPQVEADAQKLRFFDRVKGRVFQHPASINFHSGRFESGWLVYTDLIETSKVRSGCNSNFEPVHHRACAWVTRGMRVCQA